MSKRWMTCVLAAAVVVAAGAAARAADEGAEDAEVAEVEDAPAGAVELSPQQKAMCRRAAQLDAYRLLAERIFGLRVTSETTVRDFVTEDDRIKTHIDTLLRGARFGEVRYFDDGSCEVDAEVTLAQVVTTLKRAYDEVYKGGRWEKRQFDEITKNTRTKVIAVTGSGAARVNSNIPDPDEGPLLEKIEDRIERPADGGREARPVNLPPIYRKYPANERLKAKRAAEADAYRLLRERIYGLRLTSATNVKDFVTENDAIRTEVDGFIKGARPVEVRYNDDGVVEVVMQVTIQQVVTTIRKSIDKVDRNGFKEVRRQLEVVNRRTDRKVITVVGNGALDTRGRAEAVREEREEREEVIEEQEGEPIIVD